jgi:hypothetical protein
MLEDAATRFPLETLDVFPIAPGAWSGASITACYFFSPPVYGIGGPLTLSSGQQRSRRGGGGGLYVIVLIVFLKLDVHSAIGTAWQYWRKKQVRLDYFAAISAFGLLGVLGGGLAPLGIVAGLIAGALHHVANQRVDPRLLAHIRRGIVKLASRINRTWLTAILAVFTIGSGVYLMIHGCPPLPLGTGDVHPDFRLISFLG